MSNAEQKKSFILYVDYEPQLQMLTDEQAGRLMKAVFCREAGLEQQEDFSQPAPPQPQGEWTVGERMLYFTITKDLDRNRLRYRERVKANQENGKRGGRPKKAEAAQGFSPEEFSSPEAFTPQEVAPLQPPPPSQPQEIREEKPTGLFSKPKKPDNDTETGTETETGTDIITETKTGLGNESGEEEDTFASFWRMYPKKRNRQGTRREWDALGVTGSLWETMRNSLLLFLNSADWQKEQGRYVPSPLQFLQDRRWETGPPLDRDTGQQRDTAWDVEKGSWWDKNQISPASCTFFMAGLEEEEPWEKSKKITERQPQDRCGFSSHSRWVSAG